MNSANFKARGCEFLTRRQHLYKPEAQASELFRFFWSTRLRFGLVLALDSKNSQPLRPIERAKQLVGAISQIFAAQKVVVQELFAIT